MALSSAFIAVVTRGNAKPGKYFDGNGLMLHVREGGRASWMFRYRRGGKRREVGLGSLSIVGLALARDLARQKNEQLAQGEEPTSARRAIAQARAVGLTFADAVEQFLEAHGDSWRNAKHRAQWRATLDTYAAPKLGTLLLAEVTTEDVLAVLKPIWSTKNETASRLRGRIERILDWAKVRGLREGENPARWRGHMSHLLPAPSKIQKVEHHAAVPIDDLSKVMKRLAASEGMAALAARFCILTAARPGEVRGATWAEVDLKARVWTVPATRTKAARVHRVPLSTAALAILKAAAARREDEATVIFAGRGEGGLLSLTMLTKALRLAGGGDATLHGTARSTFRDWCSQTRVHPELAEQALAHAVASRVEAAYRRVDLLEERRALMASWAKRIAGA